jgi:hypothetical protein
MMTAFSNEVPPLNSSVFVILGVDTFLEAVVSFGEEQAASITPIKKTDSIFIYRSRQK